MPYESPNIVIVPTVSFKKKNITVAQKNLDHSGKVASSNIQTSSTNVVVSNTTILAQNMLVPSSITLQENLKPSDVTQSANKGASLADNKPGDQSVFKPPAIYVTQGRSKDACLADNKTGGQTILTPPQISRSEFVNNNTAGLKDCKNLKKPCASWAPSSLQSIGNDRGPIKLNLSSSRKEIMEENQNTPGNEDVTKIAQPQLKTPYSPLGIGFRAHMNTKSRLTHNPYKNTFRRTNENTIDLTKNIQHGLDSCNHKLTSDPTSGPSVRFHTDTTTGFTLASDKKAKKEDIKINNLTNNKEKQSQSTHTKLLIHNDEKNKMFTITTDIKPSQSQHVDTLWPLNKNTVLSTVSNEKPNVTNKEKCDKQPIKSILKKEKKLDSNIYKIKKKYCPKEDTIQAISISSKTKVKLLNTKKYVSSDKYNDKKEVEKETARLEEALKNINAKIKMLTDKVSNKSPISGKEKSKKYEKREADKVIQNAEIKAKESYKLNNIENKDKQFQDRKITNDKQENKEKFTLKKNNHCLEQTQRKRRHDYENDTKNYSNTKKIKHNNSPKPQHKKQVRLNPENETSKRSESKKIHVQDTEQINKKYHHNSENINRSRSESHSSDERSQKKHVRRNSNDSIDSSTKKRCRRSYANESNNDSRIKKISLIKSVAQLTDNFQVKHPRIQAPENCSDDDYESDFDLRSRISRINTKRYPKKNKIFYDSDTEDKIETPRENSTLNLNDEEANTKSKISGSLQRSPALGSLKQSPTLAPLKQSTISSALQHSPTLGPIKESPIPDPSQQSPMSVPTKQKLKTKKYKKIKLVINILCENTNDRSDDSTSDDNLSTVNENNALQNLDLSFLDDINVDEIVNSLEYKPKQDDKQTDMKQSVLLKDIKSSKSKSFIKDFVQPIIIKNEIKPEHIKKEIQTDILRNAVYSEPFKIQQENTAKISSRNKGYPESSNNLEASTEVDNENLTKNIIKKKVDDEIENPKINESHMEFKCKRSSHDDVYQTMNQLTNTVLEKQSTGMPCPVAEKVKDIKREQCLNDNDKNTNQDDYKEPLSVADIEDVRDGFLSVSAGTEHEVVITHENDDKNINQEESVADMEDFSENVDSKVLSDSSDIKLKHVIKHEECENFYTKNINQEGNTILAADIKNGLDNLESQLLPDSTNAEHKLIIKSEQCEKDDHENINKEGNIISVADMEDVLKKLHSKLLSDSTETTEPKLLKSNIIYKVSASGNTLDEATTLLDEKIQEENNSEMKPKNEKIIIIGEEDYVSADRSKPVETNITQESSKDEPVITSKSTTVDENTILSKNNNGETAVNNDNLSKEDRVLAGKIKTRLFIDLQEEISVVSFIKQGRFSKVFKCMDTSGQHLAVKVLNNSICYSSGIQKITMVKQMQKDIPKENLNAVYFISGFDLERTWCFLMEYYPRNLQQALKQNHFHIDDVQSLAKQLVGAVTVLRNKNIVHSDLRPSHILLDDSNQTLKVCGFDGSYYSESVKILPNIGTLIYRAPEIILGFSAGFGIDVWSTALILYEMATGKKLFHGIYNNDILYAQMCLLGTIPFDMVQASPFASNHFTGSAFIRRSGYKGQNAIFMGTFFCNSNNILHLLYSSYNEHWGMNGTKWKKQKDLSKLASMHRLLEQMLVLDPRRRLPIEFVYADPFIYNFP